MALPVITQLPEPPNRSMTPEEFVVAADNFMAAFELLTSEINNLANALVANNSAANFVGTSTTSLAIGTGTKAFTTQTGKLFQSGQWVVASSAADPTAYMIGYINSYSIGSGALSITVTKTGGAGTKTDWVIGLSGIPGLNPGQWTQQASQVTTSNTSWAFTSISNAYSDLAFDFLGFSGNSTGALRIELSSDNGGSYTSPASLLGSTAAASSYRGAVHIPDYLSDTGLWMSSLAALTPPAVGSVGNLQSAPWALSGPINAVRFSLATGSGDAGSIIMRQR